MNGEIGLNQRNRSQKLRGSDQLWGVRTQKVQEGVLGREVG